MNQNLIDFMARESALSKAQREADIGLITEDRIMDKARQYESYLTGRPIPVTSVSSELPSQSLTYRDSVLPFSPE